mmetsp:Transcript_16539/g.52607  ORF Transcript_16539/g.52607 Transcript_16539/m.52607 type:complete len:227 (-) Transcript_16539:520-1200(-)
MRRSAGGGWRSCWSQWPSFGGRGRRGRGGPAEVRGARAAARVESGCWRAGRCSQPTRTLALRPPMRSGEEPRSGLAAGGTRATTAECTRKSCFRAPGRSHRRGVLIGLARKSRSSSVPATSGQPATFVPGGMVRAARGACVSWVGPVPPCNSALATRPARPLPPRRGVCLPGTGGARAPIPWGADPTAPAGTGRGMSWPPASGSWELLAAPIRSPRAVHSTAGIRR